MSEDKTEKKDKNHRGVTHFFKAYFVYDNSSEDIKKEIESNDFDIEIVSLHVEEFIAKIDSFDKDIKHIVISLSQENISDMLELAYKYKFSIGVIPPISDKQQIKTLYCSDDIKKNIDIALRDNPKDIDLVEIDSKLMHSQAVIGTVPLLSKSSRKLRSSFFKVFLYGIKKFFSIELQKFKITTANGREIITAGSAIIIFNHTRNSFISKMFDFNESIRDGKITIVIISPFSILEYIKLMILFFVRKPHVERLPKSIGYIKSESFNIEADKSKRVYFDDGGSMPLPVSCKIIPNALKLNASEKFWEENKKLNSNKETIK